MKQLISRRSFDPRRGDLGVYLQEGAPFVDSTWNEATDLLAARIGALAADGGIAGGPGQILAIQSVLAEDGQSLANLIVKGGKGRFYCGGVPILWPEDRRIDAQDLEQAWFVDGVDRPKDPCTSWLSALDVGKAYTVYAIARTAFVDDLDEPDLDDPGLDAERGSFRARARAEIRVGTDPAALPRTNLRLTVQGTYIADANALYWVELVALDARGKSASLLWDDAGAGLVALVPSRVKQGDMRVPLSQTDGFEPGSFVRFEGEGVGETLYEVVRKDAGSITVTRHDCGAAPKDISSFSVGSLRALPDGSIEITLHDDFKGKGPSTVIEVGDTVRGVRATPDPGSESIVYAVKNRGSESGAVVYTLVPTGLVDRLDPWYSDDRATRLVGDAHAFKHCVEVELRPMWTEGTCVRFAKGALRLDEVEDRSVVRIAQHATTMTLRLDRPLSYPHGREARVLPQRLIKARRYAGHACAADVVDIDPSKPDGLEIPGLGVKLPSGLSLHLTFEPTTERTAVPTAVPGDGWTFAARASGWVETRAFAPVLEGPGGVTPLARLTLTGGGAFTLEDIRPTPFGRAKQP